MRAPSRKEWLFFALNLVQGGLVALPLLVVPSRDILVNWALAGAAGVMLLAAFGVAFGRRIGRYIAVAACLFHIALGSVLAAGVAASASYLFGIYGRHGHAAGTLALIVMSLVLVGFWFIPAHELYQLRRWESRQ